MRRSASLLFVAVFVASPAKATSDRTEVGAGCFQMGCPAGTRCDPEEMPAHAVCLDTYEIDRREVTVGEHARCVAAGACPEAGKGEGCNAGVAGREGHPANCLSWRAAEAYCRWTGGRLPTEAEWERSARGRGSTAYPWGDGPPTCELAVIEGCGHKGAAPSGSRPAGGSPEGASDLAGNVFEYVHDWYRGGSMPDARKAANPRGPCDGASICPPYRHKVMKGGSWNSARELLRGWARYPVAVDATLPFVGFRCARAPVR